MKSLSQKETVLIVDDEADICALIKGIIEDEGYNVRTANSARQAYQEIERAAPDLIVLDIWLQGSEQDGMQILANVRNKHPIIPVIMISGHGTIETAVNSIKLGAYDFIEKPFKSDRLTLMVRRALEASALRRENDMLKKRVAKLPQMIGSSSVIQSLRGQIERVAQTNSRVMLTGEAGAGKDIAARMTHVASARAMRPFVAVNCATMRPDRLEMELFGSDELGHEAAGLLEQADRGTLFLDEVADMPLETQGKILRVLQEQKFSRVGGQRVLEVDVRIIASTNRNLEQIISEGKFRQDLFYRLNVVPIRVPNLRERINDIPELANYFAQEIAEQSGLPVRRFSGAALAALQAYRWPGNVRQLRNAAEWSIIMKNDSAGDFEVDDLPPEINGRIPDTDSDSGGGRVDSAFMIMPLREARENFEREYLQAQVTRFGGNISRTAQFVGMERSALHRKLKTLEVVSSDSPDDMADDPQDSAERKTA